MNEIQWVRFGRRPPKAKCFPFFVYDLNNISSFLYSNLSIAASIGMSLICCCVDAFMRVIESLLIFNTFRLRCLLTLLWSVRDFSDAYQSDKQIFLSLFRLVRWLIGTKHRSQSQVELLNWINYRSILRVFSERNYRGRPITDHNSRLTFLRRIITSDKNFLIQNVFHWKFSEIWMLTTNCHAIGQPKYPKEKKIHKLRNLNEAGTRE